MQALSSSPDRSLSSKDGVPLASTDVGASCNEHSPPGPVQVDSDKLTGSTGSNVSNAPIPTHFNEGNVDSGEDANVETTVIKTLPPSPNSASSSAHNDTKCPGGFYFELKVAGSVQKTPHFEFWSSVFISDNIPIKAGTFVKFNRTARSRALVLFVGKYFPTPIPDSFCHHHSVVAVFPPKFTQTTLTQMADNVLYDIICQWELRLIPSHSIIQDMSIPISDPLLSKLTSQTLINLESLHLPDPFAELLHGVRLLLPPDHSLELKRKEMPILAASEAKKETGAVEGADQEEEELRGEVADEEPLRRSKRPRKEVRPSEVEPVQVHRESKQPRKGISFQKLTKGPSPASAKDVAELKSALKEMQSRWEKLVAHQTIMQKQHHEEMASSIHFIRTVQQQMQSVMTQSQQQLQQIQQQLQQFQQQQQQYQQQQQQQHYQQQQHRLDQQSSHGQVCMESHNDHLHHHNPLHHPSQDSNASISSCSGGAVPPYASSPTALVSFPHPTFVGSSALFQSPSNEQKKFSAADILQSLGLKLA